MTICEQAIIDWSKNLLSREIVGFLGGIGGGYTGGWS